MKNFLSVALALAVVGSMGAVSQAALLAPGGSVLAAGGPGPLPLAPPITSLTSTLTDGPVSAVLTTEVFAPDPTSPLPGFTFVYLLQNNATTDFLSRLTVDGFAGAITDVDFAPGSYVPTNATRSTIADDGDVVGFNLFDSNLLPGFAPGSLAELIVHTDATTFTQVNASIQDGGSVNGLALAPSSGVGRTPEPASLGLLGLGGLAMLRRRK